MWGIYKEKHYLVKATVLENRVGFLISKKENFIEPYHHPKKSLNKANSNYHVWKLVGKDGKE